MSSYIGWIPNYGGMITFPKGLVNGFEGGCVSGGIQGVELSVDGFEAENDSVSSKYHVTANKLMKDIAIIGLLVTSIGLMIGWML